MTYAYICDFVRTPIGRFAGPLSSVRADDLGAIPLRALMDRNPKVDWEALDNLIYGNDNQAGEYCRNIARMSLLLADIPLTVPDSTTNRHSESGIDAVLTAARDHRRGGGHDDRGRS